MKKQPKLEIYCWSGHNPLDPPLFRSEAAYEKHLKKYHPTEWKEWQQLKKKWRKWVGL